MPPRRVVTLLLEPLSAAAVAPFGVLTEEAIRSPAAAPADGLIECLARCEGARLELKVQAGDRFVLGPASDPMRCRALPGERELRAFRASGAGHLRLNTGVWFHSSGATPEGLLDRRSLAEIFDTGLALREPPAVAP